MSGGGGSKASAPATQTVQTSNPWVGQQGHLSYIYNLAQNAMAQTPQWNYPTKTVADVNGSQQTANTRTWALGEDLSGYGKGLRNYGDNLLASSVNQPYLPGQQEGADTSRLTSLDGSNLHLRNIQYLVPALKEGGRGGTAGKARSRSRTSPFRS